MNNKFQQNFNTITNIIILFILVFGGIAFADSNGVWHETKDIRPGIFGSDENDISTGYHFQNLVHFTNLNIFDGNTTFNQNVNLTNDTYYKGEELDAKYLNENQTDSINFATKAYVDGKFISMPNCPYRDTLISDWNGNWVCKSLFAKTINVTVDTANYNLATELAKINIGSSTEIEVIIYSTIYSTSTSTPAFDTGILPPNLRIRIINNGQIIGKGGNGGSSIYTSAASGYWVPGEVQNGGVAFKAQSNIILENKGLIGGGGGGGAPISGYTYFLDPTMGGGGGGAGMLVGSGGYSSQGSGSAGTTMNGGSGSSGGAGGNLGQTGGSGAYYTWGGGATGIAGGTAGKSIEGNSFITWEMPGNRLGPIS